jgi:translation initiation factor IF-2
LEIVAQGLGNITEAEVLEAEAVGAKVFGFNVLTGPNVDDLARDKGVEIHIYKVIYDLFDDIVARLNKLVPPEVIVTPLGNFEVMAIFRTESDRMIVGGKVRDGKILSASKARVWRGADPVGIGVVESVQIGKQTVKDAFEGRECGLSFKGKTKIQIGDRLEIYKEEVKERKMPTIR